MEYITITSDSYENAVGEARAKYGSRVRIISRRDYTVGGGLFTKKRNKSEIVCYLSDSPVENESKATGSDLAEFEKEAQTPDPDTLSAEEKLQTVLSKGDDSLKEAEKLLELNDIRAGLAAAVLDGFVPSGDLPLELGKRIISNLKIDYASQAHPGKYMVFLGQTGSGKTTTLAKIAHLYSSSGLKVGIISLDSYRVGAYEQLKAFADAFDIESILVREESEMLPAFDRFALCDLVLVDTMGISPADGVLNLRLDSMLSQFDKEKSAFVLVCSATTRENELMRQFRRYNKDDISSLIVTKLDEAASIGSFLTFCYESGKPMLFASDGQKVPDALEKISTTLVLEHLEGFALDIDASRGQLV